LSQCGYVGQPTEYLGDAGPLHAKPLERPLASGECVHQAVGYRGLVYKVTHYVKLARALLRYDVVRRALEFLVETFEEVLEEEREELAGEF